MTKYEILNTVISIFALGVSLYVLYKQSPSINVSWTDFQVVEENELFYAEEPFESNGTVKKYLLSRVTIVNHSPFAIGYFDLRAFEPTNNMNYHILTKLATPYYFQNIPLIHKYKVQSIEQMFNLRVPDAAEGIIPAFSCVKFDILLYVREYNPLKRYVCISFKIPKKNWFKKYKYSNTNRAKYETYEYIWDTENVRQPSAQKQVQGS